MDSNYKYYMIMYLTWHLVGKIYLVICGDVVFKLTCGGDDVFILAYAKDIVIKLECG